MAPRRSAHRNFSYHCSRTSSFSTSASARATRLYVSSIVLSMGVPSFAVSRHFLSQLSRDASWKGTASISCGSILTMVFMNESRTLQRGRPSHRLQGVGRGVPPSARPPPLEPPRGRSVPPKSPPEPKNPDRVARHKILCRGHEPNETQHNRQEPKCVEISQNNP